VMIQSFAQEGVNQNRQVNKLQTKIIDLNQLVEPYCFHCHVGLMHCPLPLLHDLERLWTAQEAMCTWRGAVKLPLSEKTMPEAVLSVVVNEEVTVMLRVKMITFPSLLSGSAALLLMK